MPLILLTTLLSVLCVPDVPGLLPERSNTVDAIEAENDVFLTFLSLEGVLCVFSDLRPASSNGSLLPP